jgi:hypothetical protein
MTYEELIDQIRSLPLSVASQEHGSDADHVEDDVAAAMIELVVAANLARAAQESLKVRVEVALSRGATWPMIGKAIGLTPSHARQRKWETRPLDARW